LSDGGTIALDWHGDIESEKPIVAIVPGVVSDSYKIYVINTVEQADLLGYNSVVIN
jgi:predicted alpha/beta-fold hydrolase